MATKPAKKRAARKTTVQTDRQQSSPPAETEPVEPVEGTEEETKSTEYEPKRTPLESSNYDHVGAEEKRQAELQAERDEHNRRTGDASRSTWT